MIKSINSKFLFWSFSLTHFLCLSNHWGDSGIIFNFHFQAKRGSPYEFIVDKNRFADCCSGYYLSIT